MFRRADDVVLAVRYGGARRITENSRRIDERMLDIALRPLRKGIQCWIPAGHEYIYHVLRYWYCGS